MKGSWLMELTEKYVTDSQENKIAVLLEIEQYQKLLDSLEELEAIKAYDEVISSNDEEIPFEVAVAQIDKNEQ